MSFAKVLSAQVSMLAGQIIFVEVDISRGLNNFSIVGLPDKAVDEARDRVGSALKNSGYTSPKHQNQKTIVSLSPANIKKEGPYFDTAIAIAYLIASGELVVDELPKIFVGELSLDGQAKPLPGILPIAEAVRNSGMSELYVPMENVVEAALVPGINVYGYKNLSELVKHLDKNQGKTGNGSHNKLMPAIETNIIYDEIQENLDFSYVRGQESAKRGLLIAAAGGHNIAMYGPPGTGKTMLARAFNALLPHLEKEQVLEVTGIHSSVSLNNGKLVTRPPFRSPHHTASYVAIIGGGANVKPGEVTLAHRGVLFLDEFPEFDKKVIESLRQPMEDGIVTVARAKGTAMFPSNFILVAAMNPCPCGYNGTRVKQCVCSPQDIARYQKKLSGPIVDRIDMWVPVEAVDYEKLGVVNNGKLENEILREKIIAARTRAKNRFDRFGAPHNFNAELSVKDMDVITPLTPAVRDLLNLSASKLELSPRAYHRIIRLARTIADLDESETIEEKHILEALQYRPKVGK